MLVDGIEERQRRGHPKRLVEKLSDLAFRQSVQCDGVASWSTDEMPEGLSKRMIEVHRDLTVSSNDQQWKITHFLHEKLQKQQ